MTAKLKKKGDVYILNLMEYEGSLIIQATLKSLEMMRSYGIPLRSDQIQQQNQYLGCLYESIDGTCGVVNALGSNLGSLSRFPYVRLNPEANNIYNVEMGNIHLTRGDLIRKVLFFVSFKELNLPGSNALTGLFFTISTGEKIEVVLDANPTNKPLCALALLTIENGIIQLAKENKYLSDFSSASAYYGFNLRM